MRDNAHCGDCLYAMPDDALGVDEDGNTLRRCVRFPPVFDIGIATKYPDELPYTQPVVLMHDMCGEYQRE